MRSTADRAPAVCGPFLLARNGAFGAEGAVSIKNQGKAKKSNAKSKEQRAKQRATSQEQSNQESKEESKEPSHEQNKNQGKEQSKAT